MNSTFGVSQQELADLRQAQGNKQMYNTQKNLSFEQIMNIREQHDPLNYGFDIQASNQLNRINWKMNRWKRTQESFVNEQNNHIEVQKKRIKKFETQVKNIDKTI